MERPNFEEIVKKLENYSENLKDNSQIGNSKLVLTFAEMIKVMGWSSHQSDTNNIQVAHLIDEMKLLRRTIDEANEKSGKLEQANYRLQMAMVFLTGIGTLVVAFPIIKSIFVWISTTISPISTDWISVISGVLTAMIAAVSVIQVRRLSTSVKDVISVKDKMRIIIKDEK